MLRHHEYTSASASSPSFGPPSFWADAQPCLRARRRHRRRWRRWATECAAIDPLRLNHAIGRTPDLRHRHEFDPHQPNPHSFVAFSSLSDAFRGFLHGGLSNTCPQAVGELGAVVVHGQVSDNPRPKRKFNFLRSCRSVSRRQGPRGPTESDPSPPCISANTVSVACDLASASITPESGPLKLSRHVNRQ